MLFHGKECKYIVDVGLFWRNFFCSNRKEVWAIFYEYGIEACDVRRID